MTQMYGCAPVQTAPSPTYHATQHCSSSYICRIVYAYIYLGKGNCSSPAYHYRREPSEPPESECQKQGETEMIGSMIGREAKCITAMVYQQPYARLQMAGTQAMYHMFEQVG